MFTVALLTGRGNNTLKDKNVILINGEPVLYYPAIAAVNAEKVDDYYCSSDDDKILNAAHKYGYKKIVRPAHLATPTAQHSDCIYHALDVMAEEGVNPEIVVVLLANNVTVKAEWIDDCIKMMEEDPSISAVVPIYQDNDHHPLRAKKMNKDGMLEMFMPQDGKKISTNRQDLEPCYYLAHNFWVLNVKTLQDKGNGQPPWSFMGHNIKGYVIEESIDIHDEQDIRIAEYWTEKHIFNS